MKQKIKFTEKCLFCTLVGILCLLISLDVALAAEKFPERPIKIMVGYAPGGTVDLTARLQASLLTESLGQPVIVINKTGAAGTVAAATVAESKPDGYTVGNIPMLNLTVSPHVVKVKYDPSTDLDILCNYAALYYGICVLPEAPWKSLKELIEYARQNPNAVSFSTVGTGSNGHLMFESITKREKVKMKHVPYQGGIQGITALMGGHVQVNIGSGSHLSYLKAGKVRQLASYTEERMTDYPEVPTLKELGYDIPVSNGQIIVIPKGVSQPIRKTLEDAFRNAVTSKPFVTFVQALLQQPKFMDSAATKKLAETHYNAWGKIVADLGIKAQ